MEIEARASIRINTVLYIIVRRRVHENYTAKNLIPIRGRKRARYGTDLRYRYVQLGQSLVIFVWGLPYSSNRHVTPVSVRGRKGLTCSIRAPPCPRFDTLRQAVSNRAQLFSAVYGI